ncbi:MAG: D-alanyl-D-alanine carboxypeptidase [Beijerinckiaceae bacterium]|nr:D-alanyl-D-alanine carboxypeptidase [Beijerinckiaceae bacterium]
MVRRFRIWVIGLAAFVAAALPLAAQERAAPFETAAKQAILFDHSSRAVLFEREADRRIAPASLAKLMTVAIVFREIKEGRLKPEDDMVVSVDAWRRGGAVSGNPNMLLTPNRVIKVSELLTGLIVGGANDAAITLAQGIAGQEPRFVELMNAQAQSLGMRNSVFQNATGYAAEGQVATLRDLVILATHLIDAYPELYPIFAQRDFPLGRGRQVSRNPLLPMEIGADGLATGFLPETGQAIIGSAVQDGRRLIVAMAGLESVQERALEARKMLEWGFRRFEIRTLFPEGARIGEVAVYGGQRGSVPVQTAREVRLPLLRGTNDGTQLRLVYRGPLPAPVEAGREVARLEILIDGRLIQSAPLVSSERVAPGGVVDRARDAALEVSRQVARNGIGWVVAQFGWRKKPEAPPPGAQAPATTGSTGTRTP